MINPTGNLVILEKPKTPNPVSETASGLFIVQNNTDSFVFKDRSKVVAVGPGKIERGFRIPMSVKVGDTVIFHPDAAQDFINPEDGEKYLMIAEQNIQAIIDE